ncbi:MAG: NAD(P)-dependent oxidoreductase [Thermodesulfobacteriota bacterium]
MAKRLSVLTGEGSTANGRLRKPAYEGKGMMPLKVGFVGTGTMGQPMALNILKSQYALMVYNRTVEKTAVLTQAGALLADNPRQLAQWSDVIILMLTGPDAIDAVLEGRAGILAGLSADKTLVNMSTVSPGYSRRLSARLQAVSTAAIDAPVSGSRKPAEEGKLVILAGGPRARVSTVEPLLLAMGKKVVYCGEAGQGAALKLTLNLLLAVMMEGFSEAVNFGERCGLSPETIIDTILNGLLGCDLFHFKAGMLRNAAFPAQFALKHMSKDLGLVVETAMQTGAVVPVARAAAQLYHEALTQNMGDMDFAAVKMVLERLSLSENP